MTRPTAASGQRRRAARHAITGRTAGHGAAGGWTLLREASVPLAILLAGALVDLFANTILGRLLGPEDYGDYAVAISAATICGALAKLGADETLPRFLPGYLQNERFGFAAGFLRGQFGANMAVAVTIAALVALFYNDIKRISFDHPLAIIWVIVPLIALNDYLFETLVTLGAQTAAMALQTIMLPAALVGAIYAVAELQGSTSDHSSVLAFGVAILTLAPVYVGLAVRHLPLRVWKTAPAYDVSRWVRFGTAVALSGFAFVAYTQLSLQLVEWLDEDESNVGRFAAATKISDLVLLAGYAVHITILPRIAPLLEDGRPEAVQRFVGRVATVVVLGGALLAALVIVFRTPLTQLFGEGFDTALGPLIVMAIGNVALGPMSFAWTYLSLSGHEREPPVPIVIGFFLLAVSSYLVVPVWHIIGAAICQTAVGLGVYGWMVFRLYRVRGLRLWRLR